VILLFSPLFDDVFFCVILAIDLETLPLVQDMSKMPGKKEGEIKVFRNGQRAEAYMWKAQDKIWEKIGDVVGQDGDQQQSSGKTYAGDHIFPAGEYDYVFDVDMGDGYNRLLPFNDGDNELIVAEKFIGREGINHSFVEQISEFLRKNSRGGSIGKKPKQEVQNPNLHQQNTSKHFPMDTALYFEAFKLEPLQKKLFEFNQALTDSGNTLALDEAKIKILSKLLEILGNKAFYHSTKFTQADCDLLQYTLLKWPDANLLPVLDLLRVFVLHPDSRVSIGVDNGDYQIRRTTEILTTSSADSHRFLVLRYLSNMFKNDETRRVMASNRAVVLSAIAQVIQCDHKQVRLGVATVLLNYSTVLRNGPDNEGKIQILNCVSELINLDKEAESVFRALVALGNLIANNVEMISMASGLGIKASLASLKVPQGGDGTKVHECAGDIQRLL